MVLTILSIVFIIIGACLLCGGIISNKGDKYFAKNSYKIKVKIVGYENETTTHYHPLTVSILDNEYKDSSYHSCLGVTIESGFKIGEIIDVWGIKKKYGKLNYYDLRLNKPKKLQFFKNLLVNFSFLFFSISIICLIIGLCQII